MRKMGIGPLVGALIALCTAMISSCAFAADVDWKFYGTVSGQLYGTVYGKQMCFYDAAGATRRPDGHIHVWTKCLLKDDIDRVDIEKDYDVRIFHEAARRLVRYYVLPITTVLDVTSDQRVSIVQYEEIANISSIEATAVIFYELNCSEQMLRELTVRLGDRGGSDKPLEWKYVAPETAPAC